MVECMNKLHEQGYKKQFKVTDGKLDCLECDTRYTAEQIKINEFYRFEGESDPADMSVVYAIETEDGLKGTLVESFGTYSEEGIGEFLQKVKEVHKGKVY